jgi:hypothetical protein
MKTNESVTIELDLKPINPKKQKRHPDAKDFANEYVIKITRNDGFGVSQEEAELVIQAWMMNRRQAKWKKNE